MFYTVFKKEKKLEENQIEFYMKVKVYELTTYLAQDISLIQAHVHQDHSDGMHNIGCEESSKKQGQ